MSYHAITECSLPPLYVKYIQSFGHNPFDNHSVKVYCAWNEYEFHKPPGASLYRVFIASITRQTHSEFHAELRPRSTRAMLW